MRIAVFDLGTNTFNILVADIFSNDTYHIIHKDKLSVKLGEGFAEENKIAEAPFNRGVAAISEYVNRCSDMNVEQIYAVATSAVRSAVNGKEFVQAIKDQTGVEVHVVSGQKEAELIFHGVQLAMDFPKENTMIMDIGGGSTEFIIVDGEKVLWKHSYDLGIARLLARFEPEDPIHENDIERVVKYLEEHLEPLINVCHDYKPTMLIGSSGSFDTFAEMIMHRFYNPEEIDKTTTYDFDMQDFHSIYDELIPSTREERYQMKGLVEMRVDMIVLASVFVKFILEKLEIKQMRQSAYALKEGVIWQVMKNKFCTDCWF